MSLNQIRYQQQVQQARVSTVFRSSGQVNSGQVNTGLVSGGQANTGRVSGGQIMTYQARDPITGNRELKSPDGGVVLTKLLSNTQPNEIVYNNGSVNLGVPNFGTVL